MYFFLIAFAGHNVWKTIGHCNQIICINTNFIITNIIVDPIVVTMLYMFDWSISLVVLDKLPFQILIIPSFFQTGQRTVFLHKSTALQTFWFALLCKLWTHVPLKPLQLFCLGNVRWSTLPWSWLGRFWFVRKKFRELTKTWLWRLNIPMAWSFFYFSGLQPSFGFCC